MRGSNMNNNAKWPMVVNGLFPGYSKEKMKNISEKRL